MKRWIVIISLLNLSLGHSLPALAVYSSSNGYRVDETLLGGTGLSAQDSTSFSAQTSSGDITVGDSSSANKQAKSSNISSPDPALTMIVNTTSASFGVFSTTLVSSATATFSVKNYTSVGYTIQIFGNAPSNGGYTLPAMASNAASAPGTEQFGLNLAANTGFGAAPVQIPSSNFSFGQAATNYDTSNSFRYATGDTIATATKSSGQTDYTMSYIVNVKGATPAGAFSAVHTLICVGTY